MSKVAASYYYCTAQREPIARIDRIEPGFDGASKSFLPYLWDPSKGQYNEKPGLNGTKLPLYHFDEVRAAIATEHPIFFPEGEGKGDVLRAALRESGSQAAVTTIPGGANAPLRADHVAALAGAPKVYFLADSDHPGCSAASERAQAIARAYPRCDVRIIDPYPERDDGSDVADWLREGHTIAELDALIAAASQVHHSPMADEKTTRSPLAKGVGRVQPERPAFVRASELLSQVDDAELEYAVDGLLPLGGTAVLAGRPKGGKSTLGVNLALAVARGEPFLGRQTRKGTVLYLALEGAPRGWKALLRSLGATNDDNLLLCIDRAPEAAIAWLAEEVEKHQPVLVVVDTMQRLLRVRDGNDYATGSNATDAIIELARRANASLLMLHHSGKTRRAEIVDEVMGSTAWAAAVDTVLVLRRSERFRTLASEQRFGENLPETVLEMDPSTHQVHTTGTKAETDRATMHEAIVDFLQRHREQCPDEPSPDQPTIEANVEGRTETKRGALREAVADGRIVRTGTGRKGDPYRFDVSCSLVPDHILEQENENREIAGKADEISANACSRDSAELILAGTRNPEDTSGKSGTESADGHFDHARRNSLAADDAQTQLGLDL